MLIKREIQRVSTLLKVCEKKLKMQNYIKLILTGM